jgi:hypothetical protein
LCAKLFGELDNQNRVLGRQPDQHDEAHLAEHIIGESTHQLRGERAEHRDEPPGCQPWRPGEQRNVHHDMMRLTTNVVTKTLFNSPPPPEIDEMGAASEAVMERFTKQWSLWRFYSFS